MIDNKPEPEFVDFIFHATIATGLTTPTSHNSRKASASTSPLKHKIKRSHITPLHYFNSHSLFSTSVAVPANPLPDLSAAQRDLRTASRLHRPAT